MRARFKFKGEKDVFNAELKNANFIVRPRLLEDVLLPPVSYFCPTAVARLNGNAICHFNTEVKQHWARTVLGECWLVLLVWVWILVVRGKCQTPSPLVVV